MRPQKFAASFHPQYRADIDGLRAAAVLAVALFHAFPSSARGGFIGVDIFFVISGYLISSILLRNLEQGTFSIRDFYARRARRIFPALILVLLFSLGAGWLLMVSDEYKMLGKHVVAGALFFSNFAFWQEAGYFDPAAELKPLLHLWSLGIEEQFYIFWPLILLVLHRSKIRPIPAMLVLLVSSFALNLSLISIYPIRTFYLPDTRAWELIAGGLLASLGAPGHLTHAWLTRRVRNAASVGGALLIGSGLALIKATALFPGWWALLPVGGAFLLILAGPQACLNRSLLSCRPMVALGRISYPLYLWHWPLLSFVTIAAEGTPDATARAEALLCALVMAWLTVELLEKRVRFNLVRFTPARLFGGLIAITCGGTAIFASNGLPGRHVSVEGLAQVATEWEFPGKFASHPMRGFDLNTGGGNGKATLYFGDSNMEMYGPRIYQQTKDNKTDGRGVIFFTHGGCAPLPDVSEPAHPYCEGFTALFEKMALDPRVDTVVIAATWFSYFNSASHTVGKSQLPLSTPAGRQASMARLQAMLTRLSASGKRVYLVLNIPLWGKFAAKSMIRRRLTGLSVETAPVPENLFMPIFGAINVDLKKVAVASGARIIDPLDSLCPGGICPVVDAQGSPIYRDITHLRPKYVAAAVRYLDLTVLDPT